VPLRDGESPATSAAYGRSPRPLCSPRLLTPARIATSRPSGPARRRCALDESVVLILSTWTYAGTGYTTTPAAELAAASAARAREHDHQADTAA
jgi:hypothetical protein